MTPQNLDSAPRHPPSPLLSWLLPSAAMIAGVVGFAVIAASWLSHASHDDAAAVPEIPAIGSVTGASSAIGERPFAYLEFDWSPASAVPGFDSRQEPRRLAVDAGGR